MALGVGIDSTIVGSDVLGISVFTKTCGRAKFPWVMFAALTINHAGGFWELGTAGTVHHALCDGCIKYGLSFRVRDLSRDDRVDMSSIINLEQLPQDEEEMYVRQTMLLKFYGEDKSKDVSKETVFNVFEHGLHLLSKDMCDNVGAVCSHLMSFPLIWIIVIQIVCEEIVMRSPASWD